MAHETPWLSVCPRIEASENCLTASSSGLVRVLSLGLYQRLVVVDEQARTVSLERRFAGLARRRTIIFLAITAVTYGYEDAVFGKSLMLTHDSVDRFTVGLRLVGGEQVHIFSFIGDGTFGNDGPLPDWMYWKDFAMDCSGTQEKEARLYAQLLSN